jgi:hypothetical protein
MSARHSKADNRQMTRWAGHKQSKSAPATEFDLGSAADVALAVGVFHPNCLSDELGLSEHFGLCPGTISPKIREFFLDKPRLVAAIPLPTSKTSNLDGTAVREIDPIRQNTFPEQRGESRGR